jgi:hypothetical protein
MLNRWRADKRWSPSGRPRIRILHLLPRLRRLLMDEGVDFEPFRRKLHRPE